MTKLGIATLLVFATIARAQTPVAAASTRTADRDAVRAAVLDYVEGFYSGDTARLVRSVSPQVVKYGYWRAQGKTAYEGEPMSYAEIVHKPARPPAARPNAPKDIEIFEVQDQTASAKLKAWWGTDYILLAKEQGRWMIRAVLWQGPLTP